MAKNKCLHCEKTIVAIGSSRENGAMHKDWSNRKYHKKCYKELQWITIRELYERKSN